MNAKDLIQVMKGDLELAHQKKIQQLNIEQINNWIDDLDNLREESTDEELTEELKIIQLQKNCVSVDETNELLTQINEIQKKLEELKK